LNIGSYMPEITVNEPMCRRRNRLDVDAEA
jgi:hypothetical protein